MRSKTMQDGPGILGTTQKDRLTGYVGVATGYVQYISGCNQVLVVPQMNADGKLPESHWFDVQRLERVGTEQIVLDNTKTPGFDKEPPKR
ncbi:MULTISPECIES: hypothetical protein [Bradyrhizobium]|uniref:hypothetical protein n=2 Tax=Bradyrhizobium TaxID=374 RepID=UPI0012FD12CF|nr:MULTISPECIES: hypothetical protein [Bradyrhizobium]MBR0879513.1 hypothetical protein [Bradyrhizobium liaoningense]